MDHLDPKVSEKSYQVMDGKLLEKVGGEALGELGNVPVNGVQLEGPGGEVFERSVGIISENRSEMEDTLSSMKVERREIKASVDDATKNIRKVSFEEDIPSRGDGEVVGNCETVTEGPVKGDTPVEGKDTS